MTATPEKLSIIRALIATFCCALVIFFERAFPFILFNKKEPPKIIKFIEKYIPAMVMAALLLYCLKDIKITSLPFGLPQIIALGVTIALHLWKHNSLISIFSGTAVFMILSNFF